MAAVPSRSFEDVRALLLERARRNRNPFTHTPPDAAERIVRGLTSTAHGPWVDAFDAAGLAAAEDLEAYGWWRVARYPAPTSAAKRDAYRRSQERYLRAMAGIDPAIERVAIPFHGRPGEGSVVVGHLRRPRAAEGPPVLVVWGGIDAFKEERRTDAYLAAGIATLAIDMPGTGDAPLVGSTDAERMWDDVLAWVAGHADLDRDRIAVLGSSTGGYWAAKLSRTHRDRIRAAVDHGGPVHAAFMEDWVARSQVGEYPFELAETLAAAFGGSTYEDWLRIAPTLSLAALGVLDRPSAPLLVVHGEGDTVFPVADARLLIDRGANGLITAGGHMGSGEVTSAIVRWLMKKLI
ncbi:MAG TPA: alpha/beta fold hydrolase [Candidatus Limnocylindria bacterium]